MLSSTLRLSYWYLKIIHILHPCYDPKQAKGQVSLYSWDYTINHNENEGENEKRSQRYDINSPRSRHRHKYSEYKKCLSMMMLMCINQYPSNIWSSIHEELKQHWGWVEKKALLIKKVCISTKPTSLKAQYTRCHFL